MSITLATQDRIALGGSWQDLSTLVTQVMGTTIVPAPTPNNFTYGSGAGQATLWYLASRTLAASAQDLLNLNSGALLNPEGAGVAFATIKRIVVSILNPDGTAALKIGPQNASNACQLNFGGLTAPCYNFTRNYWWLEDPITGFTVTPSTACILPITNVSSSVAITYGIWILGN